MAWCFVWLRRAWAQRRKQRRQLSRLPPFASSRLPLAEFVWRGHSGQPNGFGRQTAMQMAIRPVCGRCPRRGLAPRFAVVFAAGACPPRSPACRRYSRRLRYYSTRAQGSSRAHSRPCALCCWLPSPLRRGWACACRSFLGLAGSRPGWGVVASLCPGRGFRRHGGGYYVRRLLPQSPPCGLCLASGDTARRGRADARQVGKGACCKGQKPVGQVPKKISRSRKKVAGKQKQRQGNRRRIRFPCL